MIILKRICILLTVITFTQSSNTYSSYALAPIGISEAGIILPDSTHLTVIPEHGRDYTFNSLLPVSYIGEDPSIADLIIEAKKFACLNSYESKLLAGDCAIQSLNKIVENKETLPLPIDVSDLVQIVQSFETAAYDKTGLIKELVQFLSINPNITQKNISTLEAHLDDINNMNERTELSLRIIRHQEGYNLDTPIQTFINCLQTLTLDTNIPFTTNSPLFKKIHTLILINYKALSYIVRDRIDARKEEEYSKNLPTLSIAESVEWRRTFYELLSLKSDETFNKLCEKEKLLKESLDSTLYSLIYTFLPIIEGKAIIDTFDFKEIATQELWKIKHKFKLYDDNIINLDFSPSDENFTCKGDIKMIREVLNILMHNSYLVAKESLEDMNEAREQHKKPLTFKDKPIEIKISFKQEDDGSISIQLIEVCDNVGGISDPEMLEETKPGSGRQKITRLNISRRRKDTGFGLAYVWHAINLHGGTFWIENLEGELGKGIRASIRIPFDNRYKQATAKPLSSSDSEVLNSQ